MQLETDDPSCVVECRQSIDSVMMMIEEAEKGLLISSSEDHHESKTQSYEEVTVYTSAEEDEDDEDSTDDEATFAASDSSSDYEENESTSDSSEVGSEDEQDTGDDIDSDDDADSVYINCPPSPQKLGRYVSELTLDAALLQRSMRSLLETTSITSHGSHQSSPGKSQRQLLPSLTHHSNARNHMNIGCPDDQSTVIASIAEETFQEEEDDDEEESEGEEDGKVEKENEAANVPCVNDEQDDSKTFPSRPLNSQEEEETVSKTVAEIEMEDAFTVIGKHLGLPADQCKQFLMDGLSRAIGSIEEECESKVASKVNENKKTARPPFKDSRSETTQNDKKKVTNTTEVVAHTTESDAGSKETTPFKSSRRSSSASPRLQKSQKKSASSKKQQQPQRPKKYKQTLETIPSSPGTLSKSPGSLRSRRSTSTSSGSRRRSRTSATLRKSSSSQSIDKLQELPVTPTLSTIDDNEEDGDDDDDDEIDDDLEHKGVRQQQQQQQQQKGQQQRPSPESKMNETSFISSSQHRRSKSPFGNDKVTDGDGSPANNCTIVAMGKPKRPQSEYEIGNSDTSGGGSIRPWTGPKKSIVDTNSRRGQRTLAIKDDAIEQATKDSTTSTNKTIKTCDSTEEDEDDDEYCISVSSASPPLPSPPTSFDKRRKSPTSGEGAVLGSMRHSRRSRSPHSSNRDIKDTDRPTSPRRGSRQDLVSRMLISQDQPEPEGGTKERQNNEDKKSKTPSRNSEVESSSHRRLPSSSPQQRTSKSSRATRTSDRLSQSEEDDDNRCDDFVQTKLKPSNEGESLPQSQNRRTRRSQSPHGRNETSSMPPLPPISGCSPHGSRSPRKSRRRSRQSHQQRTGLSSGEESIDSQSIGAETTSTTNHTTDSTVCTNDESCGDNNARATLPQRTSSSSSSNHHRRTLRGKRPQYQKQEQSGEESGHTSTASADKKNKENGLRGTPKSPRRQSWSPNFSLTRKERKPPQKRASADSAVLQSPGSSTGRPPLVVSPNLRLRSSKAGVGSQETERLSPTKQDYLLSPQNVKELKVAEGEEHKPPRRSRSSSRGRHRSRSNSAHQRTLVMSGFDEDEVVPSSNNHSERQHRSLSRSRGGEERHRSRSRGRHRSTSNTGNRVRKNQTTRVNLVDQILGIVKRS